jgi:two-component system NtrC family sensor kinase
MERGAKPAKAKVEARPPVARKSQKVDGSMGRQLEQRLPEALEQQAATSDILRAISQSPADVQPVFDTIVRNAVRLCGAIYCNVLRYDGEMLHIAAHHGFKPETLERLHSMYPMRPAQTQLSGRVILERRVAQIRDALADERYDQTVAAAGGWRRMLAVPMTRDENQLGVIAVAWADAGETPRHQVELLKTFADQAVIAIENARLFNETSEALDRQTATAEILKVISSSPTDVQPVFDTIAAAAMKLCRASSVTVTTFDGELLHLAALAIVNPEGADAVRRLYPRPPGRDTTVTRAVLTRSVVAIPDVLEDPDYAHKATALAGGFRSTLAVPLMRERNPIGAITVGRPEPGPFPDKQIALLQTFADQAVIAIQNVRLFKELETRNRDLTEA